MLTSTRNHDSPHFRFLPFLCRSSFSGFMLPLGKFKKRSIASQLT